MLPPQYIALRPEIVESFNALPRLDNASRHLWLQRVEEFGTHIITHVAMGGRSHMSIIVDVSEIPGFDTPFISKQAALLFAATADPDPLKRRAADDAIDSRFKSASKVQFHFDGGQNLSDFTARQAWLDSLLESPTWIRMGLRHLHEFFPPSQTRIDVELAAKEYLFSKLSRPKQELFLGPEFDAALLTRGASVNVSSIRTECNGRCWADDLRQTQCVDSNCDHPCCDPSHNCIDAAIRQCVCEIDAFCCDNWDDDCNKRVTSAGCVNCNCIRRKWDASSNNNAGGCEVLVSTQQFCEDPYRGQGRWEVICVIFDNRNSILVPGNQERFIFNAKDPAQSARVSLGRVYFVKRAIAEVSPPPNGERFVVQSKITDNTGHVWGFWGPSGPDVNRTNEAVESWCREASEFLFEFGPAHDLVGSMIYGLRVLAIEDSSPAGCIDSISRFEIVGWAFDPIAPERILEVQVFVDGILSKTGSTGVERADIISSYGLPPNSKPGFRIPISLSGAPRRLLSVHTEWIGVFRRQKSENVTFWTMQPPGQILDVSPSAARGWAYLVDFPAMKYEVEIWANGKLVASGFTGTSKSPVDGVFDRNATMYGFLIPLELTKPMLHIVTARIRIPGTPERYALLEQPVELDLRYPTGSIVSVTAEKVEGWAFNPAFPEHPVEVSIYVDDGFVATRVTNLTSVEINKRFLLTGPHGFSVPIRTQGGRLHTVSAYANVAGTLYFLDEVKISLMLEDRALSRIFSNDALNFLGSGYNPCFSEWRLRAVDLSFSRGRRLNATSWNSTPFEDLLVPDELQIEALANQSIEVESWVLSNMSQWGAFILREWPFARQRGVVGGGLSQQSEPVEHAFSAYPNQRWGIVQRIFRRYTVTLSTHQLSAYAALEAEQLLPYNQINRPLYFRFFDKFGTAFAESLSLGTRVVMEAAFAARSTLPDPWETDQLKNLFIFLTTNETSPEHNSAVAQLDPEFLKHTSPLIRFVGGRARSFNVSDMSAWATSADSGLAVADVKYANIWDLVPSAERREWLQAAAADYINMCTPEHWLCNLTNIALRSRGAQIIGVSSRFLAEPDVAVFNLIAPVEQQQTWGPAGESHFLFADGDQLQYILLQLPTTAWVSKVSVELDSYPSERGVWDFVRVDWSVNASAPFKTWGLIGEQNGRVEVLRESYSFVVPDPVRVRYLRFVFGAVRQDTRKGARIRRLYVYACDNKFV
eukprot:TRINITY_DN347_c0_g1_i1.p1 TRINITY_DN347_c0_g1~~TRINITY_DN347_c0_g1_i1.p1  ORF type:complete len:1213 (-),score=107.76 TRINITY_DN347_c0_g1_i1:8-3646(-)